MSAASSNGYRSEVIGSLLRPDYLKQAADRFQAGQLGVAELTEAQDRAVREAISLQESCGIDVITDGEMRRWFWFDPLTASLSGYDPQAPAPAIFTSGQQGPQHEIPRLPAITGRLGPRENLPLRETTYLRQQTSHPCKATLPSMSYASVLWVPGLSDKVYPDRDAYLQEALGLLRDVVRQLVDSGARYVQLDAPRYTHLCSEEGLANFRRLNINTGTWLGDMIALDNAVMAGFSDVTFGLHLCRGNHRSMWSVEGGYDPIADQLFNTLNVQRLLLEYDTPRAGTFEPLRFVPGDKTVVLGLITTKEPEIETADLLQRRVNEAARFVPLERLALSPQCGFASTLPGNLIDEGVQRAKLETLGQVSREIWS